MNSSIVSKSRYFLTSAFLTLFAFIANAQDKIEIDKQEVGSWFSRNWMWVVGGVVLLIIIFAVSGSSSATRRTKVVERDDLGNVRTTTTTETTT